MHLSKKISASSKEEDIVVIKERLGHSTITTIDTYGHFFQLDKHNLQKN